LRRFILLHFVNFWPPYFGAGIRVTKISPDKRSIDVEMKLRFWNKNYVGTHFGGSLYAMTDPFFMLILIENLGHDYIVWDKAATIRFKAPGRGRVRATFELSEAEIDAVRRDADANDKAEAKFLVKIFDDEDVVVAEVEKLVSVRRKDKPRKPRPST
jgi:hypothetical protein